jgi:two-component system response regulator MprA
VVEDDSDLQRLLRQGLGEEGFVVTVARTGREALAAAEADPPDLIVLDIGLPDSDGRDLCQALRGRRIGAPILFLTALDAATDRISGFGAGGDDYVTKPFEFAELVARLRALARRSRFDPADHVGDLRLDPVRHTADAGDASVSLTPTEFRLLGTLVARAGETIRRRDLVAAAWPTGAIVHDNTLDVYVAKLRRKLTEVDCEAQIHTAHRIGYRLE